MATIPLSYMIRESQFTVARAIADWMNGLGFRVNQRNIDRITPGRRMMPYREWDNRPELPFLPWSPDNQTFEGSGNGLYMRFTFAHEGWDPDLSSWDYGPRSIVSSGLELLDQHTYLFDNAHGVEALDIDLDESVTYKDERSTSLSESISLDFGAKQKGTIGVTSIGAQLEAEISEAFGIKTDKASAESKSKTTTRAQKIRTKVPVGKALEATISAPTTRSFRDFVIDGAWLSGLKIAIPAFAEDWDYFKAFTSNKSVITRYGDGELNYNSGDYIEIDFNPPESDTSTASGIDAFLQMLDGHNIYFPDVEKLPPPRLAFFGLEDQINRGRRVQWHGRENQTNQSTGHFVFSDVTQRREQVADRLPDDHVIDSADDLERLDKDLQAKALRLQPLPV